MTSCQRDLKWDVVVRVFVDVDVDVDVNVDVNGSVHGNVCLCECVCVNVHVPCMRAMYVSVLLHRFQDFIEKYNEMCEFAADDFKQRSGRS